MYERTEEEKANRRENIITAIVLCGGIPLFVYSFHHVWAWVLLKLYLMTAGGFGYILFNWERASRHQRWFRKAMLLAIPIHILCMTAFAYLNLQWITVPIRPLVSYVIVFVVFVVEFSCLMAIIDKFRPPADTTIPATPPEP